MDRAAARGRPGRLVVAAEQAAGEVVDPLARLVAEVRMPDRAADSVGGSVDRAVERLRYGRGCLTEARVDAQVARRVVDAVHRALKGTRGWRRRRRSGDGAPAARRTRAAVTAGSGAGRRPVAAVGRG